MYAQRGVGHGRLLVKLQTRVSPRLLVNITPRRLVSTGTTSSTGTRTLSTLAIASVVGGLGGYFLADTLSDKSSTKLNYENPVYGGPKQVAQAKEELRKLFSKPGAVSDDSKILETYGYSHNSYHPEALHSVVVKAFSTEDVVKIVKIANTYRIPVVAYAGGTSLEGHFSGVRL